MRRHATSLPAYAWPEPWVTRRRYAPWRWLSAGVFQAGRLAGVLASAFSGSRRAIAVVRTDGVGDALLFEPALRSLARQFDGYAIDLWVPGPTRDLFEAHPVVSRIVTVPRGFKQGNHDLFWSLGWRATLGWRLGRHAYDAVVYPASDPEPLGNWLVATMRARERCVVEGSTLNQFDWQRDLAHASASTIFRIDREGAHELDRNAQLAALWGTPLLGHPRPQITLSQRATTYGGVEVGAARHAVRRTGARGLIGVIAAGSSELNRYPIERWVEALRLVWEDYRLLPALLGAPQDIPRVEKLDRRMEDASVPRHRFAPTRDIAIAAAIVRRLDALISVDTGLAHAAVAFDVPTVVLVSGGMPGRFFPWPMPTRSAVLTRAMPCAGCNYRCTQPEPLCLTEIEPAQVAAAVGKLIETARRRKSTAPPAARKEYRNAG